MGAIPHSHPGAFAPALTHGQPCGGEYGNHHNRNDHLLHFFTPSKSICNRIQEQQNYLKHGSKSFIPE
jgi:hypothetical protein